MFLATHVPSVLPSTTSLPGKSASETSAALASIDSILRRALSRSSFGANVDPASTLVDDIIAVSTMIFFLLACFMVFLAVKLLLGVLLLGFARRRYKGIKERERMYIHTGARRGGAFGGVTVSDDQKAIIYEGDPEGKKTSVEMERAGRQKEMYEGMEGLEGVTRYKMCAKRIW
jgi:hypothetical protein